MNEHEKINYLEIPSRNLDSTKAFFSKAFDWLFIDYGPEYTAFSGEGIDGGFFKSEQVSTQKNGSVLVVFYSEFLEQTEKKVYDSGGRITQAIFSFPGGRRFHFTDPNGNEYAVWSDQEAE